MAWIESHQSLSRHRKLFRLCSLLGTDKYRLIGHLHELWWWAMDNVQRNGDFGDITNAEIAQGAGWDGDPDEFVNALIAAGFIDQADDRLFLHDWEDYTARYYEHRDLRLLSSESGILGNHERWHVRRGVNDPSCPYCNPPTEIPSPGESGGESGGESPPNRNQPNQPTNQTNPPRETRARAREGPDGSTGDGGGYERLLDECVVAWNESDPPTSKSLAAISVSRRKHCDAALKAGVPSDFLIEVIRREAPAGTQPWKIRQMAVREFRNKRPWEMGQKKQDGVPNAGAYELVDPQEVQEFAQLMYGDA